MKNKKTPIRTKPNVHLVRDFEADGCCKERSDGIAIVTKSIASAVIRYFCVLWETTR